MLKPSKLVMLNLPMQGSASSAPNPDQKRRTIDAATAGVMALDSMPDC